MKDVKQQLNEDYERLVEMFGVRGSMWDMIHLNYSSLIFCKENRLSLITEYLIWKDFVDNAKKHDVPYYIGIDKFLKEYKDAVMSRINLD